VHGISTARCYVQAQDQDRPPAKHGKQPNANHRNSHSCDLTSRHSACGGSRPVKALQFVIVFQSQCSQFLKDSRLSPPAVRLRRTDEMTPSFCPSVTCSACNLDVYPQAIKPRKRLNLRNSFGNILQRPETNICVSSKKSRDHSLKQSCPPQADKVVASTCRIKVLQVQAVWPNLYKFSSGV
jgi:hypothetical protein